MYSRCYCESWNLTCCNNFLSMFSHFLKSSVKTIRVLNVVWNFYFFIKKSIQIINFLKSTSEGSQNPIKFDVCPCNVWLHFSSKTVNLIKKKKKSLFFFFNNILSWLSVSMISRSYVNFPLMQQKRTLYRECYTCIHNLFFVSSVTVICASGGKWVGILVEMAVSTDKAVWRVEYTMCPRKSRPPKIPTNMAL